MTYVIAQPCVDTKDKACVAECPVDCINEGKRMFYIYPDECVDCGDIGLPGGASSVNVRDRDHYEVEAVDAGR